MKWVKNGIFLEMTGHTSAWYIMQMVNYSVWFNKKEVGDDWQGEWDWLRIGTWKQIKLIVYALPRI